jgi:ubiquinone/menaquinone biosynthesis C-methylase UbiE
VGIYGEQILPRLTNVLLGSKAFGEQIRAGACTGLHGEVIELGFGSGLNVPYYPPEVCDVWIVEPSAVALRLAASRIAASTAHIHEGALDGARLDFPDDRFDGAISTMTLCTISDIDRALAEVRRVLKPGAELHFAEHGLAPDSKVARFQQRFDPWQMRFAGGCHLARDMRALLTDAGFEIAALENRFIKGPKAWSYMYLGRARVAT